MSLTGCIRKAGNALSDEDRSAVLVRAAELRGDGLTADAAAKQAVREQLDAVTGQLAAAERPAIELQAPTRADVLAQQDRAGQADQLDERAQIEREAGGFGLQAQSVENREDNTGDMFGGPSLDDAIAARDRARANKGEAPAGPDLFSGEPATMFDGDAVEQPAAVPTLRERVDAMKALTKPDRLTDAGEELIRNRRGKLKGLAWDDVSAMNDTLKVAQVVKGNVWPRPDYTRLVEDGMPAWKAAMLKAVYDSLAAAPKTATTPTDADLKAYIQTMGEVRDALMAELDRVQEQGSDGTDLWKTLKSGSVFGKVFPVPADARPVYGAPSPFDRNSEQGKANNKRAMLIGGNAAMHALQFGYKALSKAKGLIAEGFPAKQEAWQKSYEVRQTETRNSDVPEAERTGQPRQRFYVYEKGSRWRLAKGGQDGGYGSQEAAEAFARSLVVRKKEALPPSRGLDLADASRTGPDWRDGKNVTAQDIMDRFGFRGVNLGEYVKAKQGMAQLHLNHVFDAFSDLADLLGVPPKAMSLNGTLGVAVGAQGSGKALAHFVPGVNEINITRDSGAGALAHEFGHAVDHYFAAQHGRAASTAKRPYLSAAVDAIRDPGNVRPEVVEAMRAVMKTLNSRQMTEAEARKYIADQRDLNQRRMDRWVKEFSSNKGADPDALAAVAEKLKRGDIGEPQDTDIETNIAEFVRAAGLKPGNAIAANAVTLAYRLNSLADEAAFMASHIPQVDTDYAKASKAMDAKKQNDPYWSSPWEMFARAFETFALDALADRQRQNLYLSGLVDSAGWQNWAAETGKSIPYPAGDERLAMQQAFQTLVDTIETREEGGNTAMFSIAEGSPPPFYSALARAVEGASMKAAPAAGWQQFLKGLVAKGTVKADEIEWTGVNEWLELQGQMGGKSFDADLLASGALVSPAQKRRMAENPGSVATKITREQLAEYLNQNGVRVTETVLGTGGLTSEENVEIVELIDLERRMRAGEDGAMSDEEQDRLSDLRAKKEDATNRAKYAQYTLPGGTNYRELLLTLPDGRKPAPEPAERPKVVDRGPNEYGRGQFDVVQDGAVVETHQTWSAAQDHALAIEQDENIERNQAWQKAQPAAYKSNHWDQPNVLAHIRVNDRTAEATGYRVQNKRSGNPGQTFDTRAEAEANIATYPEAMRGNLVVAEVPTQKKVLFVEEIQSDWGQAGKKSGFADPAKKRVAVKKSTGYQETVARFATADEAQEYIDARPGERLTSWVLPADDGPPAAPFVTATDKWVTLALKRVVKMAVDGGYDKVAFVTGEQSAERYNLSKQVRSIEWTFDGSAKGVTITPITGNDIEFRVKPDGMVMGYGFEDTGNEFGGKRLDEVVGKDVADKIMAAEDGNLSGDGLKIGGQGMRAFYDKIVPSALKDVLRKVGGGAVGPVTISMDHDAGSNDMKEWTGADGAVLRVLRNGGEIYVSQRGNEDIIRTEADLKEYLADNGTPDGYFLGDKQGSATQPGFAITPAMREKAAGGLPLFKLGDTVDAKGAQADTAAYEPAGTRHTELVQRIAAGINSRRPAAERYLLDAVAARTTGSRGQRSRELAAVTSVAKRLFGQEVVLVKFTGKPLFNGMVDDNIPGVIFINADSQRPMMAVLGHELLHKLRKNNPEIYRDLVRRLGRVTKDTSSYFFDLEKKYKDANFPMPKEWVEELHADIVGDNFTDPQFWQELAADQPSLFKRLANAILKFLDDVAEQLAGVRTFGTERYLTDIAAARTAVADAMRQFSENQTEPMADTVDGIRLSVAERQAVTDTPAFRKWFGDSKVVDADGKPLVVYHGTASDFDTFRDDIEGRAGFYFTADKTFANSFAEGAGANVIPAYLSIKNPANLRSGVPSSVYDALESQGYPRLVELYESDPQEIWNFLDGDNELSAALQRAGYDGMRLSEPTGRRQTHSWVAFRPEQIKSAIGNSGEFDGTKGDIRLSVADEHRTAQDFLKSTGGVFDFNSLGETKQDRVRTVIDKARPFWLGALTRDQIADVFGAEIPQIKDYDHLTRAMENQRSSMAQHAEALYEEWAKLPADVNDRLSRIMLDATVAQVHPDQGQPPDGADRTQRQTHARLSLAYRLLPPEGKAMYRKVRDHHAKTLDDLRDALLGRMDRLMTNGSEKQLILADIRRRFDGYLGNGPYFPLSRFGDYIVVANRDDGERVVATYATAGEQQAAARALQADGFTVKMKAAKNYNRSQDGAAGKFIGDVLVAIEKADFEDGALNGTPMDTKAQLMDEVNQLFIRALPDMSYRKHFSHRKNTPGFSADVMRGFASSAFHAASHIARLNHGDKMTAQLQEAFSAIESAPEGDFNKASQVLNEIAARHEKMLNPDTHPIAALATQVGFVMYLGLSPAAGLINMLQVPMVALPFIGARHGFTKASAAMAKAYKDIMGAPAQAKSGFNGADSPKLTAAERQAIATLQDEGVIDLTQAHDLASATSRDMGNQARSRAGFAAARAMRIVGWTFHVPEVMNRQVTALMAYRLEKDAGATEDAAMEAAREAIKRTQFDYSSSNRARYMSGNVARVVTQFKQFSQNMTYFLARAAYQALKDESPEVRRIARKQLLATFMVTGAMAGSMGLPGIGFFGGLLSALVSGLGDDDEPWDWKVEYRNALADTFGKDVAEVMAKGVPRALMPAWDISGRVSLSDLWWRDGGREGQNPREKFAADMGNVLGPTAGTLLGWYTAADHMNRGNYGKAVEAIVPKFIRDPLKAAREATNGVTSYTGEPLMDTTLMEDVGRVLGFAPARAAEMYEGRNAVMNAKTAIEDARQSLVGRAAKARIDRDTEAIDEIRDEIRAFNARNPRFKITGATIAKSVMTRKRNRSNTEDGIMLPDSKDALRDRGRFAVTQ